MRRAPLIPLLTAALLTLPACGYHLGAVPRDGVRRIHVPVFANQSLRRGFERDLTRAVQREIKETTPYLLSGPEDADLTLEGEIINIAEDVLIEGPNDEVLESNIQIAVSFKLLDSEGTPLPIRRQTGRGGDAFRSVVFDRAEFVLPRGETRDTATREAIREMAERIVQTLSGPP